MYAALLCILYIFCFLGNWSPVHCRVGMSLIGMGCIYISILAGQGISYFLGYTKNNIQESIPFLMLGIGLDDIFVLCTALDQTSLELPPLRRIRMALAKAGPAITMTSLTNALAFFAGYFSLMDAQKGLCMICMYCILCLYTSVFAIFAPVLYWDTLRVHRKSGDLGGLCFCKEDSQLFCKG